jgi:hypothetical protein
MISIVGLDKAAVLAALYNRSRPQGMGFLQYDPAPMTVEEARSLLAQSKYFDYLKGRVLKVSLEKDEFDERLYDRDNGPGAAASAVNEVREGFTNSAKLEEEHEASKRKAARELLDNMGQKTTIRENVETPFGKMTEVTLGLDDVAEVLAPAVKKAVDE